MFTTPGVRTAHPEELPQRAGGSLTPKNTWQDKAAYDQKAKHLACLFTKNFGKYADKASEKTRAAGPRL